MLLTSCSIFTKTEYKEKRIVVQPLAEYTIPCLPSKPDGLVSVEDVLKIYKESLMQCNSQITGIVTQYDELAEEELSDDK